MPAEGVMEKSSGSHFPTLPTFPYCFLEHSNFVLFAFCHTIEWQAARSKSLATSMGIWVCVSARYRCSSCNTPTSRPPPLLSFFGCNLFHWLCGCLGPEKFSSLAIYDSESGAEAKEFQPSHLAFTLGEKWILSLREGLLGRDPLRRLSAIISFKYKSHLAAAHDDVTQLKSLTLRQQKALQWLTFWFRGPKWKAENSFQSARLFVFFLFFFSYPIPLRVSAEKTAS